MFRPTHAELPYAATGETEDWQERPDVSVRVDVTIYVSRSSHKAILIGAAGYAAHAGFVFALGLAAFAAHLGWQIVRIHIDDPDPCLRMVRSNRDAGRLLVAALGLDAAGRRAALGGAPFAPRN